MKDFLASAWVIARRDYTATVFSRTFLLFLLGPLVALAFGGVFGVVGGRADDAALRPVLAIIAEPGPAAQVRSAYDRVAEHVGVRALPDLRIEKPSRVADADRQARALLGEPDGKVSVVLVGLPSAPRLIGPQGQIDRLGNDVRLILDEAATNDAFARAGLPRPDVSIAQTAIDPAKGSTSANRHIIARAAQFLLFFLTLMLAGMLLSNFVEEKSNKVIEVLAAAVPIDAIFFGKMVAMLCVSVTGVAIWGSVIAVGVMSTIGASGGPLPVPGVGWPGMVILGVLYFVTNYMILGGIFIGIGAQANSAREVQTLSMPVTMAQLAVFALASATVNDPGTPLALFAQIFPISAPLAMLGRAAQEPSLWPHALALAWQALWVFLIVRFAAKRFRSGVLKSGGPKRGLFSRGKARATA
jgi:ABC-2 type transport system permease protein